MDENYEDKVYQGANAPVLFTPYIRGTINRELHTLHTRHRLNIPHRHHIYTILTIYLTWRLLRLIRPQLVVPLTVLFAGNLPVPGCGIKAEVPQMLLQ